jgi:hypothetical protein
MYGDEVFYTTREEDDYNYHNSLRRLNLNNCKEKSIIKYDENTYGEWEYLYNSKNQNEIFFYDDTDDDEGYIIYRYDMEANQIVNQSIGLVLDIIDYDNYDTYYYTYQGIYYNDTLIYPYDDTNKDTDILFFDKDNIYLADHNSIYVLNKMSKQITEKRNFPFKEYKEFYRIVINMKQYSCIDDKIYQYHPESNSFSLIFENPDNLSLDGLYSDRQSINDYYLFSSSKLFWNRLEYKNNGEDEEDEEIYDDYDYDAEGEIILLIFDDKGKNIVKEYNNGHLLDYLIDNDTIYLVYYDNTIKKIETKTH